MPIGRGRDRRQRDARRIDGDRALEPLFAPIHGAATRHLATAWRLGDAAIDRHVVQLQADHPVVGGQGEGIQGIDDPGGDPLVPATPQCGRRAGGVGNAPIGTAEDQHLDEFVEDDAIRNATAMTTERMEHGADGEEGGKLVPDGLDDG